MVNLPIFMNYSPAQKKNKGFIQHQLRRSGAGFTLIEILVVMGVLSVLFSIILFLINPAGQFGRANNAQRRSDIAAILNSIGAYTADNKGVLPTGISTTAATITDAVNGANICALLVPKYIPSLPTDPSLKTNDITTCTNYNTGYTVVKDANNRVTIAAPNQEVGDVISITR